MGDAPVGEIGGCALPGRLAVPLEIRGPEQEYLDWRPGILEENFLNFRTRLKTMPSGR